MSVSFPVTVEHDDEDGLWYVRCTSLQGCHTFGTTRDEAIDKIKEVIAMHLSASLHVEGTDDTSRVELVA